ncbi:MAG: hypothetical protein NZL89_05645, partial [Leptospiraceae bacterium]|nr:hypothetical protein [Leptospiraceae bacterium]
MRRSLGLVLWLLLPAIPAHATVVSGGVLDLTAGWDGVLRLDGAWAFFPSEFIDPKLPWQVRATIEVPGSWGARRADLMPSHQGFA